MTGTYYKIEMLRIFRDPVTLFFAAVLPAFFYIMFGARADWGAAPIGNGNAAMYTMLAMGAFGAVTANTVIGGSAALERMQGWGRQLGLTPLGDARYVGVKTAVALSVAAIPLVVTFILGWVTVAQAPWWVWLTSGIIIFFGSAMFALYGLCFALAFRTEAAVSAASGSLVVFGFLGNVFMPLSGIMLTIAKFTPMYGLVSLARYPLTQGQTPDLQTGEMLSDPLWAGAANVVVWTILLAIVATWLVRRSRNRL